ncbi:Cytochrome P450, partial [Macrophomina phaseolina MS6]
MYNFTTFDVMGDLTFGEALGLLEASEYSPWVKAIFSTVKSTTILATINSNFPTLGAIIRRYIVPQSLMEQRKMHAAYAKERVDSRLAKQTDRPDIWTFVLRHNDSGKGMNSGEMHANGAFLMLAGTETTATLLSGLTYHLLRNPDKLQKLTAEIRSTFASPDDMNMLSLGRLT